ncbi:isopentenyl-diphosphate Delta-isomerase [Protaetiibacter mangrovi]|uniref:Isopentenyl-diphosphate Delta-isomerase n=1 Tax=Protaetiibacter mangrovi TaxID=2970926 RepID=A0ABT1ZHF5_9MICO|nr:isopentenyl-diphosphate Delta-isomerase [Protaetiibacter mangrovi]MCS0500020.1 isopentenyl-diphosphate Delta-isomerase [Protaetiibacter mangrovi]TPX05190.1 isopentenyl-diphosphate Delta-isomerase [Schumannella luteola]
MSPAPDGTDLVLLLDEDGKPIGTAPKATVHGADTPLHFAFSCHVFNPAGRLLVTRRALGKDTFAGVWTNAFCGHPAPGETAIDAIQRRAQAELGVSVRDVEIVLPHFRYRAADANGIVENEICPVFRAVVDVDPKPSTDEVAEWVWAEPMSVRMAVTAAPFAFSPWFSLQLAAWPAGK